MWKPTKVRAWGVEGGGKEGDNEGTGAVGERRCPPYGGDICLLGASWLTQGVPS